MNILVANNTLDSIGGAETYTYAMAHELLKRGHNVEYFTFSKGLVSKKLEKLGAVFMSKDNYDLILANHQPVARRLFGRGFVIQTTHGINHGIDEPSLFADFRV